MDAQLPLLLPPLPQLPALPVLPAHEFSPWFPMDRKPWEHGYYEIKLNTGEVLPYYELWDGREWPDLRRMIGCRPIAWRGRGHS